MLAEDNLFYLRKLSSMLCKDIRIDWMMHLYNSAFQLENSRATWPAPLIWYFLHLTDFSNSIFFFLIMHMVKQLTVVHTAQNMFLESYDVE